MVADLFKLKEEKKCTPEGVAAKLMINSIYGSLSSNYSDFYYPFCAAAITSYCREVICIAQESINGIELVDKNKEDKPFVLAIYTDSLLVTLPFCMVEQGIAKINEKLALIKVSHQMNFELKDFCMVNIFSKATNCRIGMKADIPVDEAYTEVRVLKQKKEYLKNIIIQKLVFKGGFSHTTYPSFVYEEMSNVMTELL